MNNPPPTARYTSLKILPTINSSIFLEALYALYNLVNLEVEMCTQIVQLYHFLSLQKIWSD